MVPDRLSGDRELGLHPLDCGRPGDTLLAGEERSADDHERERADADGSEGAVRERVRHTLDACMPGGGYCLGTGNTVANYLPLDNYLAMLDEGRRYAP